MFKIIEDGYTLGYVPRSLVIVVVEENPFTVGWHTPVNKNPFLYSIYIDKTNYSYKLLKDNFAINFLTSEYRVLAIKYKQGKVKPKNKLALTMGKITTVLTLRDFIKKSESRKLSIIKVF